MDRAKFNSSTAKIILAMQKIREQPPGRGTIPCPVCEHGTLAYKYDPPKGKLRAFIGAHCSTEGCLNFMS